MWRRLHIAASKTKGFNPRRVKWLILNKVSKTAGNVDYIWRMHTAMFYDINRLAYFSLITYYGPESWDASDHWPQQMCQIQPCKQWA